MEWQYLEINLELNTIPQDEILLITDEIFETAYLVSSNQVIAWTHDKRTKIKANIGLEADIDISKFKYYKIM